jgi:uncharacterized membrane protein
MSQTELFHQNQPEGANVMQCPACHKENENQSAFCVYCGASLAAAAPPQAVATPPPVSAPTLPAGTPPPAAASSGLSTNSAAAIAYLTFIPAVLFLIVEPYNKNPFVRFHSFQSIGLTVVWFAVWIVITILHTMMSFIPLSFILFGLVNLAVFLCLFIVWLIAILKASKGEWYKLPIIGDFALKQAQS